MGKPLELEKKIYVVSQTCIEYDSERETFSYVSGQPVGKTGSLDKAKKRLGDLKAEAERLAGRGGKGDDLSYLTEKVEPNKAYCNSARIDEMPVDISKDCRTYLEKFLFWTQNYTDPLSVFHQVYGKVMGDHFYSKFEGYYENYRGMAMVRLWFDMTEDYREKLERWIMQNYTGK